MCYSALIQRNLKLLGQSFGSTLVREQLDLFEEYGRRDPKKYPKLSSRIYPGSYAPIMFEHEGQRVIEVMRYGAYPQAAEANPRKYTTFNARRDNLSSPFWAQCFMKHHGFVVLKGFYEWVKVSDLLKAGVVKLGDVSAEFEKQKAERKARIDASGKKYKATPTELIDPRLRRIVIEFKPSDDRDLVVPVIFNRHKNEDGYEGWGFAIVTDDPPAEVAAAGHDRCPIILDEVSINEWLRFKGKTAKELTEMLSQKQRLTFLHRLDRAA